MAPRGCCGWGRRDSLEAVHAAFKAYASTLKAGKVVKVAITSEGWDRKKGIDDNGAMYDQGFVTAYSIMDNGGHGEVWRSRPRKDWLDAGKIKFDVYAPAKITNIQLPPS